MPKKISGVPFTDFICKPFRPEELFQKIALRCRTALEAAVRPQASFAQLTPKTENSKTSSAVANYREALGDEREALQEILSLIIGSYKTIKIEIEKAIREKDLQRVGNLAHRIKVSTQMLQAENLERILENLKGELLGPVLSQERTETPVKIVQSELDHLIELLEAELFNS